MSQYQQAIYWYLITNAYMLSQSTRAALHGFINNLTGTSVQLLNVRTAFRKFLLETPLPNRTELSKQYRMMEEDPSFI